MMNETVRSSVLLETLDPTTHPYKKWTLSIVLCLLSCIVLLNSRGFKNSPFPRVGHGIIFEPWFLARLRFYFNAERVLADGYRKYKEQPFIVNNIDGDIIVLPNRYLEDIKMVPNSILSTVDSQIANIGGKYTWTSILLEGNSHIKMIQNHLTPNIHLATPRLKRILDLAFTEDMPRPEGWETVRIHKLIRRIICRIFASLSLGESASRNETWLNICENFAIDVFGAALILRVFPPFLSPLLVRILPSRIRVRKRVREAIKLVQGILDQDAEKPASSDGEEVDVHFAKWLIENGSSDEQRIEEVSNRLLVLSLAAIHSASTTLGYIIFDLASRPQYCDVLRDEIESVTAASETGKIDTSKLLKLDSFIAESQRHHPLSLLLPSRHAKENITLSDGLQIPAGVRIAFPAAGIARDASIYTDPLVFDPQRRYDMRVRKGQELRANAIFAHKDHLVFGHGRQACPGRFFAVHEIKLIVARLLMGWDMRMVPGTAIPTRHVNDLNFLDMDARIQMKVRQKANGAV